MRRDSKGAFIYGSTARGDARAGSDVDLFLIVREGEPSSARRRQLLDAEFLLGRPLDIVEYSADTAQQRARSGNPFLSRVLAEPKTWIYGGPAVARVTGGRVNARIRIMLDSREIEELAASDGEVLGMWGKARAPWYGLPGTGFGATITTKSPSRPSRRLGPSPSPRSPRSEDLPRFWGSRDHVARRPPRPAPAAPCQGDVKPSPPGAATTEVSEAQPIRAREVAVSGTELARVRGWLEEAW